MTPEQARIKLARALLLLAGARLADVEGLVGDRGRFTVETPIGGLVPVELPIIEPAAALAASAQAAIRYALAGFETRLPGGFGSDRVLPGMAWDGGAYEPAV